MKCASGGRLPTGYAPEDPHRSRFYQEGQAPKIDLQGEREGAGGGVSEKCDPTLRAVLLRIRLFGPHLNIPLLLDRG